MIDVLNKIIKQRQARGWTEYMLAEKSGLPQSTISSWYAKQMLPSLTSLEKICHAFDMTMSQFLCDGEQFVSLSIKERELLENWFYLSKEQKEVILKLIKLM